MTPPPTGGPGFFPDEEQRAKRSDKRPAYQPDLEPESTYRNPPLKPDAPESLPSDVWRRVRANAEATIATQRVQRERRCRSGHVIGQLGLLALAIGLLLSAASLRRPPTVLDPLVLAPADLPPANAQSTAAAQAQLPEPLQLPRQLPGGWQLAQLEVADHPSPARLFAAYQGPLGQLRYAALWSRQPALPRVAGTTDREVNGRLCHWANRDGTVILRWSAGPAVAAVYGQLKPEQLFTAAAALVPAPAGTVPWGLWGWGYRLLAAGLAGILLGALLQR